MSMFGAKLPTTNRLEPRPVEAEIADMAQVVKAAKARSDHALAAIPPKSLPPTAGNVFAGNAVELLNKREELLNKAISLAEELDLLAKEQIACGLRLQEFMKHAQEVTSAVVETRKVLNQCQPSTKQQPSPTSQDGTSSDSPNGSSPKDSIPTAGNAPSDPPTALPEGQSLTASATAPGRP